MDFQVVNNGTEFSFRPISRKANDWIDDNEGIEPWRWKGGAAFVAIDGAQRLLEELYQWGFNIDFSVTWRKAYVESK